MGTDPAREGNWIHFFAALRDLGYVEGKNLVLHRRFGGGKFERLPELAGNLVKAKVDVIVASGTREIQSAKQATRTIPIVMTHAVDPVKQGFVVSLARPGGNVTGLTSLIPGLSQKYLELLREVLPTAKRFAVVGVAPQPVAETRRELEAAAKTLGVEVFLVQATGVADFDRAMADAKKNRAAGIIHPLDGGTDTDRAAFVQSALKHHLPGIYWAATYVEDGGLMTYSINTPAQYKRAAAYVNKVLRGVKPADLPVEQPARIELVINLKTAKALGVTIPPSIRARADRVIE